MSLTPSYYDNNRLGEVTRQKFIPFWIFLLFIAIVDAVLIVLSFMIACWLSSFFVIHDNFVVSGVIWFGATVSAITVLALSIKNFYAKQMSLYHPLAVLDYPKTFLIAVALVGCFSFFVRPLYAISPDTLLLAVCVTLLVAWPVRSIFVGALRAGIRAGRFVTSRSILLFEPLQEGKDGAGDVLRALSEGGIDVIHAQHLTAEGEGERPEALNALWATCVSAIRDRGADAVYLALDHAEKPELQKLRERLGPLPVPVYVIPRIGLRTTDEMDFRLSADRIIELQRAPLDRIDRLQKRVFDIVVSLLMLVMLAPLLVLVACAIKMDSPGPVLFRQSRLGLDGRAFRILKFRTMTVLEDGACIPQADKEDARITRLGRSLRQTSIDELPQLLNVLLGQMSLVGPRPHAVAHDDFYGSRIASYNLRTLVKPGLSGWAQVCGLRGATPRIEDMAARLKHDLWYIDNWSFWLDVKIILKTAWIVFNDRNAY